MMDEKNEKPDARDGKEQSAGDGEKGTKLFASVPRIVRRTRRL